MILKNTTDIPTRLILHITNVVKPSSLTELPAELKVRNKAEDKTHGNWGKFYPFENRITIVLPQILSNYETRLRFSRLRIVMADRLEFLAMTIAHELQHKVQWHKDSNLLLKSYHKSLIEIDAELYSIEALKRWRGYTNNLMVATGE